MKRILLSACLTASACLPALAQGPRNGRPDPNQEPAKPVAPPVGEARPVEVPGDPCGQDKRLESETFSLVVMPDPPAPSIRIRPAILNFEFVSCSPQDTRYRGTSINVRAVRRYRSYGAADDYELVITTYRGSGRSEVELRQKTAQGGSLPAGSLGAFETSKLLDRYPKELGELSIPDYSGSLQGHWKGGVQAVKGYATFRILPNL